MRQYSKRAENQLWFKIMTAGLKPNLVLRCEMNIGQASKHSGISAKMIRYYEEIGLLEAAQRSASGYRIYSETDLKTLNF